MFFLNTIATDMLSDIVNKTGILQFDDIYPTISFVSKCIKFDKIADFNPSDNSIQHWNINSAIISSGWTTIPVRQFCVGNFK